MAKNYFFPLKKSKILRKISRSGRSSSHLDLRNILSVRPHPPYEKNKLLLNEYLGDFMHFETIFFFFLRKMTFSNPPTPLKCGKFRTFFLKPSLSQILCIKNLFIFKYGRECDENHFFEAFPKYSWINLNFNSVKNTVILTTSLQRNQNSPVIIEIAKTFLLIL